jgi:hypothetical protein
MEAKRENGMIAVYDGNTVLFKVEPLRVAEVVKALKEGLTLAANFEMNEDRMLKLYRELYNLPEVFKDWTCGRCSEAFYTEWDLKEHRRTH